MNVEKIQVVYIYIDTLTQVTPVLCICNFELCKEGPLTRNYDGVDSEWIRRF